MMFKTRYNPGEKRHAPSGSGKCVKHRKSFDCHGNPILVEDGERNIYAEIQSFETETDIKTILARYANGDLTALNRKAGFYGDVSGIPTNINDVMEFGANTGKWFASLPAFVKEAYKTPDELLKAINNGDFLKLINEQKEATVNKVEKEETENEQKFDA